MKIMTTFHRQNKEEIRRHHWSLVRDVFPKTKAVYQRNVLKAHVSEQIKKDRAYRKRVKEFGMKILLMENIFNI